MSTEELPIQDIYFICAGFIVKKLPLRITWNGYQRFFFSTGQLGYRINNATRKK